MTTGATGKDTEGPGTGSGGSGSGGSSSGDRAETGAGDPLPPESVVGGPVTGGREPGQTVEGGPDSGAGGVPGVAAAAVDPTSPAGARAVVRDAVDAADASDAPPLAPDRPVVDGTEASPEELREEADQLATEEQRRVAELREEVGDTVGELAARFDVPARARAKKDEAVASVAHQAARARAVVADTASTVSEKPWAKPAAIAAAAALLLLIVLRRRRR